MAEDLVKRQQAIDKCKRRKTKQLEYEQKQLQELEQEIIEMNRAEPSDDTIKKKPMKRNEVLLDLTFEDKTEEETEEIIELDNNELETTLADVGIDDIYGDSLTSAMFSKNLAYIPCACHNIQLVLHDGLKLDAVMLKLIEHVAKDIVNKSKFSTCIAEELRKFGVKFQKKNVTRWNSILFMIRFVAI